MNALHKDRIPGQKITHYSVTTRIFHWLTATLVLIAFVYGPGGSEQSIYMATRDSDRQLHETLGLCVFALTVLRIIWRAIDTRPAPALVAPWMRLASQLVHIVLYLLLFAVPLTAITGAWLEGHDLTLLGGNKIPSLLPRSHELGTQIATLHTWLGDAILWLAGLHAAAALYHHFILKDGVMESMLPRRKP